MKPHYIKPSGCLRWSGFCLALAAVLAFAPGGVQAIGGDGIFYSRDSADEGAYFSSQTAFRIPFQTDAGDRRIQEVLLYVSTDFGKKYQKVTTAGPNEKEFRFEARGDGWYWFTVQTRDTDGRYSPPDLNLVQPALKVCVDTKAPTVTMRWLQPREGQVGVEWEARDENLDPTTLRIDYRAVGGDWIPLPAKQTAAGQYYWNAATTNPLEARIQVQDKAHNPAQYVTPSSNGGFKNGVGAATPAGAGAAAPYEGATPGVTMVNTKDVELNFEIGDVGSSQVKSVEVWSTQDGRVWTKSPEDAPPKPPYTVKLPGEGRYGLTLIARSGVGLGLPTPKAGDTPQVWVEVDTTKPEVKNLSVEVGRGADVGALTVRWIAKDLHMRANPITISYMDAKEGAAGQWQIMAANIANPADGRFTWRMPMSPDAPLPPQILVRVEAIDQAGNVGSATTPNPISTDLSIPKARVIGVTGAKAADLDPMR
jgi:hypothetical protein